MSAAKALSTLGAIAGNDKAVQRVLYGKIGQSAEESADADKSKVENAAKALSADLESTMAIFETGTETEVRDAALAALGVMVAEHAADEDAVRGLGLLRDAVDAGDVMTHHVLEATTRSKYPPELEGVDEFDEVRRKAFLEPSKAKALREPLVRYQGSKAGERTAGVLLPVYERALGAAASRDLASEESRRAALLDARALHALARVMYPKCTVPYEGVWRLFRYATLLPLLDEAEARLDGGGGTGLVVPLTKCERLCEPLVALAKPPKSLFYTETQHKTSSLLRDMPVERVAQLVIPIVDIHASSENEGLGVQNVAVEQLAHAHDDDDDGTGSEDSSDDDDGGGKKKKKKKRPAKKGGGGGKKKKGGGGGGKKTGGGRKNKFFTAFEGPRPATSRRIESILLLLALCALGPGITLAPMGHAARAGVELVEELARALPGLLAPKRSVEGTPYASKRNLAQLGHPAIFGRAKTQRVKGTTTPWRAASLAYLLFLTGEQDMTAIKAALKGARPGKAGGDGGNGNGKDNKATAAAADDDEDTDDDEEDGAMGVLRRTAFFTDAEYVQVRDAVKAGASAAEVAAIAFAIRSANSKARYAALPSPVKAERARQKADHYAALPSPVKAERARQQADRYAALPSPVKAERARQKADRYAALPDARKVELARKTAEGSQAAKAALTEAAKLERARKQSEGRKAYNAALPKATKLEIAGKISETLVRSYAERGAAKAPLRQHREETLRLVLVAEAAAAGATLSSSPPSALAAPAAPRSTRSTAAAASSSPSSTATAAPSASPLALGTPQNIGLDAMTPSEAANYLMGLRVPAPLAGFKATPKVSYAALAACFDLTSEEAKAALNLNTKSYPRCVKAYGIERWPQKKRSGLRSLITTLDAGVCPGGIIAGVEVSEELPRLRALLLQMDVAPNLSLSPTALSMQRAVACLPSRKRVRVGASGGGAGGGGSGAAGGTEDGEEDEEASAPKRRRPLAGASLGEGSVEAEVRGRGRAGRTGGDRKKSGGGAAKKPA